MDIEQAKASFEAYIAARIDASLQPNPHETSGDLDQVAHLRFHLIQVMSLIEDQVLVRNIADDHDFKAFLKQSERLTSVLLAAHNAIHHELCDKRDINPDGISKPCNCGAIKLTPYHQPPEEH